MLSRFIAAVVLVPSALVAQAAVGYVRTPGDTVRYRSRTMISIITDAPRGPSESSSAVDETIALVFGGGDSATAWWESLDVSQARNGGRVHPVTTAVLGLPFAVRVDARGRIQVVKAPPLPDSVVRIRDLKSEFTDFGLRLPNGGGALAVGAEWSDTVVVRVALARGATTTTRTISHYRAERDTTVDSVAAIVVRASEDGSVDGSTPARDGEAASTVALHGTGTSVYVFAPAIGRFIARQRSQEMSGTVEVVTGGGETSLPLSARYDGTIRLVATPKS